MAIYLFQCRSCNAARTVTNGVKDGPGLTPVCECGMAMNRDLKSEIAGVTFAVPVHMKSSTDVSRNDVLPTPKDYEAPGDTDGSKGYAEWERTHQPVKRTAWV